ncbi:MAG TPA: hypothetical protein H9822_00055 [Candidatus Yaniella excrementavium]|nr:hypothetical protein [Candidatus Yaniella excrementavium]
MTTPLSERYIAATVKDLPHELHTEVRPELEASIADAIEARVEQGEDRESAERAVLTELGDPAVLAAGYTDRPLQLIGPRYYLMWWSLLKRLLAIVPAAVFAVSVLAHTLASGDIGTVLGESIVTTISAALHVCFWVTLVFAIMERSDTDTGLTWDIDQLPEPREDHPARANLIASLVFLGLVLVALVWDQVPGFIRLDDQPVAILNAELWPWTMLGLLALIALEIGFAIVLYIRRRWTVTLAIVNTALAVLFFAWIITLLTDGTLFSAEFVELWSENNINADSLYTLAVIFGFGVAVICVWDIIDGWVKTYRQIASRVEQQPAASQ